MEFVESEFVNLLFTMPSGKRYQVATPTAFLNDPRKADTIWANLRTQIELALIEEAVTSDNG